MKVVLEQRLHLLHCWPSPLQNAPKSARDQHSRDKTRLATLWVSALSNNRDLWAMTGTVATFSDIRACQFLQDLRTAEATWSWILHELEDFTLQAKNVNYLSDATWFELREINCHIWKHSNHEPGLLFSAPSCWSALLWRSWEVWKRAQHAVTLKTISVVKQGITCDRKRLFVHF